jgi:hypothetical protein
VSNPPSSKPSLLAALALIGVGIVLAVVGFRLIGGIVAGVGILPSCYAAWIGMQQETQSGLAAAIGAGLLSLGVGAILVAWAIAGSLGSLF